MSVAHASELRGLARASTLNMVGGVATAVLTLALLMVFTRSLGNAAAGVLFSAIALFQVVSAVAGLGVETGLVRYITARHSPAAIGVDDRSLRIIALTPVVVASGLLAVATFLAAPWVGAAIGATSLGADATAALRAMAVFIPAAALGGALLGATRGYSTMTPTVILDRIGRPFFQLGAVGVAVAVHASMAVTALVWAAVFLVEVVATWLWLAHLELADPKSAGHRELGGAAREFWAFTLPRAAATTFRTILQWFDVVLVAALASPEEAAVYTVATRLLHLGLLTAFSVGQAVEPLFGEAMAAADTSKTLRLYQVATAWLILSTWPFYIMLTLFAPSVLGLFGGGFGEGTAVVVILVVSVLFGAAVGPVDILLVMTGKSTWSLWNTAISLAANLALNVWLIPVMGISGAAVAWTVSRIVGNLLPLVQLSRSAALHPFGRGWAIAVGSSVLTFGLVGLTSRILGNGGLAVAAAATVVAGAAFVAVVRHFRAPLAVDLAISSLRRRLA